ncbi:MAG: hypothetical protein JL50_10895 [Peptococcaceae bacterium BICA1-7]|nr:MAG: hypothetical protein JL50_10895 [Peptococcaceae bacterium BICA1-7]HBV95791.1 hypothetical protein [Desulfotomaculum sp.]
MDEFTNQSEVSQEQTQEVTQETTQETTQENTTQQVEQTPEPQRIKVKYNHQELELPYEEAVQHIQKGMNYDKAIERTRQEAAQQARDTYIAEQGYTWNGKPITTEAEYKEALREKEIYDRYQAQGLPEDVIQKLAKIDKIESEWENSKRSREESERKAQDEKDFTDRRNSMYEEFATEFPDYNTEEKWKTIPREVFVEAEKWLKSGGREGRRLADALTRYNWKQNMAQQQASEANQANAEASTGSVKGQAKSGTFFTRDQVANMSREEIRANYNAIKESEKRWK